MVPFGVKKQLSTEAYFLPSALGTGVRSLTVFSQQAAARKRANEREGRIHFLLPQREAALAGGLWGEEFGAEDRKRRGVLDCPFLCTWCP